MSLFKRILKLLSKTPFMRYIILFTLGNRLRIRKHNDVYMGGGIYRNCSIYIAGINNILVIKEDVSLYDVSICMYGNNCRLVLNKGMLAREATFWLEDDGSVIEVGENTKMCGKIHLAAIEGKSIRIGKNCLFSSDILMQNDDAHSVLNSEETRCNPSKNIEIGNHVWCGARSTIWKGAKIADNSIIACCAVVTKEFNQNNVAIGGNPASIIKRDISWDETRYPIK